MGNVLRDFRHVVMYSRSPFEQRAFAGFFSEGGPNLLRRFNSQVFYILPGFLSFVYIFYWMENRFYEVNRKNPADYADEE